MQIGTAGEEQNANAKEKSESGRNPQLFGGLFARSHASNENKMRDGGRDRASLGADLWNSSQKWSVRQSAVRSIVWLGGLAGCDNVMHELIW